MPDTLPAVDALTGVDLFDAKMLECPFPFYKRLRAEAPILQDPVTGIVQVSSYDLICQAARDFETFSNRFGPALRGRNGPSPEAVAVMEQGYPVLDTMLTADPPEHTRYRKLVNKAFMPKRVNDMHAEIHGICDALIAAFAGRGEVELASQFGQPLPMRVIAGQLGIPVSDMPKFRRWSSAFVAQLGQMAGPEQEVAAARDIVDFQHYFAARLAEKRAAPSDDILSDLATVTLAEEGDPRPLTTPEALNIIQQLLVAGNETTAHTLTGGMRYLIEDPEQMAAVLADLSLIPNLVDETLRMMTPTQNMWRVATRDAELGGVRIAAGSVLLLRYGSGNRDERQFPDGERFDIRRRNANRHVAFGFGIHTCLGAALARKELALAFELLLTRLRNWRFAPGKNDFSHHPSVLLRGLKALHLEFDPV
jgi:cytochrome P450